MADSDSMRPTQHDDAMRTLVLRVAAGMAFALLALALIGPIVHRTATATSDFPDQHLSVFGVFGEFDTLSRNFGGFFADDINAVVTWAVPLLKIGAIVLVVAIATGLAIVVTSWAVDARAHRVLTRIVAGLLIASAVVVWLAARFLPATIDDIETTPGWGLWLAAAAGCWLLYIHKSIRTVARRAPGRRE